MLVPEKKREISFQLACTTLKNVIGTLSTLGKYVVLGAIAPNYGFRKKIAYSNAFRDLSVIAQFGFHREWLKSISLRNARFFRIYSPPRR